jgi:hypothetical protein
LSIIQGPFSVAPCQTLISRFATFSSPYAGRPPSPARGAGCAAPPPPPPPPAPPRRPRPPHCAACSTSASQRSRGGAWAPASASSSRFSTSLLSSATDWSPERSFDVRRTGIIVVGSYVPVPQRRGRCASAAAAWRWARPTARRARVRTCITLVERLSRNDRI